MASAGGGREFLLALETWWLDGAVLDVLAEMSKAGGEVPVVVIVGNDLSDAEERALRAGATAYLLKPIADRVLLAALAHALAQAGQKVGERGQASESPPRVA